MHKKFSFAISVVKVLKATISRRIESRFLQINTETLSKVL